MIARKRTAAVLVFVTLGGYGGLPATRPILAHSPDRAANEEFPVLEVVADGVAAPELEKQGKAIDGLSLRAKPTKAVFAPGEMFSFEVAYKNESKKALRLPDQPTYVNFWDFHFVDAATKKEFVGHTILPLGIAFDAVPSEVIAPGGTLAVKVPLQRFWFAPGQEWDRNKAVKQLPAGNYKVSVVVKFTQRRVPDNNPVPTWPGDSIASPAVDVEVGAKKSKE